MKDFLPIYLCFLLAVSVVSPVAGQTLDRQEECSENATKLLKKAWAAQPMNVAGNNADPNKAEALYKEAIKDSPKCRRALRLMAGLLIRDDKYEQANEYVELLLKQYPEDPAGLSDQAYLVSILKKDYPLALEIQMKLLAIPGSNTNGSVYYGLARIYSLMNRLDDSLRYLELAMAISKGWGGKTNAQMSKGFKNLRKDKRFWTLAKKSGE